MVKDSGPSFPPSLPPCPNLRNLDVSKSGRVIVEVEYFCDSRCLLFVERFQETIVVNFVGSGGTGTRVTHGWREDVG